MSIDMAAIKKEQAKKGSLELISLNKALKADGQGIISMNSGQLVVFCQWLQSKGV